MSKEKVIYDKSVVLYNGDELRSYMEKGATTRVEIHRKDGAIESVPFKVELEDEEDE